MFSLYHHKTIGVLLVVVFLYISVTGFAQDIRVSLKVNNLEQMFTEIEKQTDIKFLYRNENVAGKKVNINTADTPLDVVLTEALRQHDLTYFEMDDNLIVIALNVTVQGIRITGTVFGNKMPMPGVNISIKGATTGVTTDNNGKYSIKAPDTDAVLIFSYIGYFTQEITVGKRTQINVVMEENTKVLEEVIVIGYGMRSKKDLTGAISNISAEEISRTVHLSPQFSMQGNMAGVYISNPGSSPVARPEIRIRGVSTLGFNDPLYVLDGIPLTEGGQREQDLRTSDIRGPINVFNLINANDIESISVLKDASATAIYGVRASNGVILITTKRGTEGKPRVNLTAGYGIQNNFKRYKLVSQQEYVDMGLEAIYNNTTYNKAFWYALFDKNNPMYMGDKPGYAKDWIRAGLNENAAVQDYNLSISGGVKITNYAVGAGYTSHENVIYNDKFDRYSFFLNSDHQLTKWLKVGESYRFIYSKYNQTNTPDFESLLTMIPWQPLYDTSRPDGLALPGRTYQGTNESAPTFHGYGYGPASRNNFLGIDQCRTNEYRPMRHLGSFYAEISPFKGFRVKSSFSFDYYVQDMERYEEPEYALYEVSRGFIDGISGNTYNRNSTENINVIKEFLAGYTNKSGDHSVDLILNAMSQQIQWNFRMSGIDRNSPIPDWSQRQIAEGWERNNKSVSYERIFSGLIGYMGRFSYNYASRYYLDATVRRDGTSKFGPGYKWGVFPSFAGAWRISSENFMRKMTWINDLKIRGGWGQTGNQETEDFSYLSLVNLNPRAVFGSDYRLGDGFYFPGASLKNLAVVDMSWETVTTFSLGFDLIAFQDRFRFTAEYYSRYTAGILQSIVIPMTMGLEGSPRVNLANVSNRGVEFQAGYNERFGDIGVHVSANLTTVKNEVSNLYRGQRQAGVDHTTIESGYPMNYYRGYLTDGLFRTQAETDAWKGKIEDVGYMVTKGPGDVIFKDIAGAPKKSGDLENPFPDQVINGYDQTYLGKSIPGYYYGFSLGLEYNNWDVVLSFRGVGDVQGVSTTGLLSIEAGEANYVTAYRNRWRPDHTETNIPRAMQSDPSGNNRLLQDRFIHDAGFLRFQHFQVGYNFRSELLNKLGVSNLRCYLSGSNLFVIAPSWPDPDPENITTPTVFTMGINVSF